ncbi:MAG: signal peptide peptidase SppA [Deltaproteobacteria bacterium]|nr:signal peptide peptidase SppA [Deltaproteobacteria bacterium]
MKKHPLALAIGVCALIVALFGGALVIIKPGLRPQALFGGKIAVLPVNGLIESSQVFNETLIRLRRDSSIQAIIIRVDSGGGGAAASQEMYMEVARTAKVKPVVGSMGGVAASGGYYLLAACNKIVAAPATVTGSIGVISTIPDMQKLLGKLGIKVQILRSGRLKGAGIPTRPLSEAEKANLQELIDQTYHQFVSDVAKGRQMPYDKVKALADGGVFTGAKAKQLGLVDELGNFQDAVKLAARLAHIKGEPTLVWPDKKGGFWSELLREQVRLFLKDLAAELGVRTGLAFRWPASPLNP